LFIAFEQGKKVRKGGCGGVNGISGDDWVCDNYYSFPPIAYPIVFYCTVNYNFEDSSPENRI